MSTFWAEHAWLGGGRPEPGVIIEVSDDRITALTPGYGNPPGDVMRLDGLTLPGFANAHSHAFHRVLRGRTQLGEGSFWTWREEMYRAAGTLDPDTYHNVGLQVFGEMVTAGYTAVGEFHYLHKDPDGASYNDPNTMGKALLSAAEEVGIRMTLLDTLYLQGGIDGGGHWELSPTQRRFSDGSVDAWRARVEALEPPHNARIGAAVHSVRAVIPDDIAEVAAWTTANDMPLHAHVSEQPAENEQATAAFGRSPVGILSESGALSARFTAVHCTHLAPADITTLATSETNVCVCPTTERDLADGIGPARQLADAGVNLCIGSDSQAVIDPFEEARSIELHERLATQIRGSHTGVDLLTYGTTNGYAAIGWPEGGRLAEGALADFVTVGLDSVRLEGADAPHMLDAVVFAATASDVTTTVIGGHIVGVE